VKGKTSTTMIQWIMEEPNFIVGREIEEGGWKDTYMMRLSILWSHALISTSLFPLADTNSHGLLILISYVFSPAH